MRLLGLDFETTGLDTGSERIIEIGAALWDSDTNTPLVSIGHYLYDQGIQDRLDQPDVADMIQRVSKLTPAIVKEFGMLPAATLAWLEGFCVSHGVNYVVAHNGTNFDKPLLMAELTRHGVEAPFLRSAPWIDTRTDIPFPVEPDSRRLKHLALDCGFMNSFPHRAIFDVLTMMKVLSHYDLDKVIEYSKIPFITVRAMVGYEDRQLAKDRRYAWEKIGEKTYAKSWVKLIKENKFEEEKAQAPFPVVKIG